jgi:hypothetical protein
MDIGALAAHHQTDSRPAAPPANAITIPTPIRPLLANEQIQLAERISVRRSDEACG